MSQYYNARRSRDLYDPNASKPFKLSRSKIDLFLKCPLCFYLDRRLGVGCPPGFPFTLNSAVDFLLKKEFDVHRAAGRPHPLMDTNGIDAVPFQHKKMGEWRENFVGVQYLHVSTNFLVFGAVDDIWINPQEELHVVDYKSTSKDTPVTLDAEWQDGYKRQVETYQWLLRKNGFAVSSTGYFVYANGQKDREAFDGKLEFDITIIPYIGNDTWIEQTLLNARDTLKSAALPARSASCDYCAYRDAAQEVIIPFIGVPPAHQETQKQKTNNETLF